MTRNRKGIHVVRTHSRLSNDEMFMVQASISASVATKVEKQGKIESVTTTNKCNQSVSNLESSALNTTTATSNQKLLTSNQKSTTLNSKVETSGTKSVTVNVDVNIQKSGVGKSTKKLKPKSIQKRSKSEDIKDPSALILARANDLNDNNTGLISKLSILLALMETFQSRKKNKIISWHETTVRYFDIKKKWDEAGKEFVKSIIEIK
ncbi:uncharacterized protein KGF55_000339 [Candida pseudojiufengensis]|uniref:uncharacterized protein n=1 Tax=Candida pseudojiufengensis TaxID=497109 RepID=UPI0022254134|nr:uncharacterized protein KGF55_000339 [Candida pseudojiufengensis]KAI5966930.1 hypothetical protein KGF55_000339 [Candida pseudojiufengensis]